jgi:drug/metabolite transporter (DMT)-like permease
MRDLDLRAAALALLLAALWGANPVAIKIGLVDAPPLRLAWMRFVLGGLLNLAWGSWTGALVSLKVQRHEWRPLAILGLLFTVQIGLLNIGTNLTSASRSTVLLNAYAVHTVVIAHFQISGDRLTIRKLLGTLIAYAGIVLLFGPDLYGSRVTLLGDLLVSVSALLLGERTIYLARAVQRMDPLKLLLAQAAVGTVSFLALSLWVEADAPYQWTIPLTLAVLYQGLVVAGFNFTASLWLLKHYRPSALAGFFLTTPIFGVLLSAVLVGDPLTGTLLLSSLLVAVGIGLTSRAA